jgi:hypothetical protein
MKYEVGVTKRMYTNGFVTVHCDKPGEAIAIVQNQINKGILQSSMVEWDEPEYEDCSFVTTDCVNGQIIKRA